MIHPNRLENESIMAPVAQEPEIIELNWEQLEGIQGGEAWNCQYFPWEGGHFLYFAEFWNLSPVYYVSPGDGSP
jgi:hypothetical protein